MDLGKPIGVSGTPYWLITIGGWKMNNRNILLQGTTFRLSSKYYPNPVRKTEVEFEGPFTGLIKYNEQEELYSWLLRSGNLISDFKYQDTKDYDLIITDESEDHLDFLDIASQQSFTINEDLESILDWSLDKASNSVVILFADEHGEASIRQMQIDSLLNSNSSPDE
jgi:hypothetical protein